MWIKELWLFIFKSQVRFYIVCNLLPLICGKKILLYIFFTLEKSGSSFCYKFSVGKGIFLFSKTPQNQLTVLFVTCLSYVWFCSSFFYFLSFCDFCLIELFPTYVSGTTFYPLLSLAEYVTRYTTVVSSHQY